MLPKENWNRSNEVKCCKCPITDKKQVKCREMKVNEI